MSSDTALTAALPARWRFDYFPISLFGAVMGLTGLSVDWRLAAARYGTPDWAADGIGAVAVVAFILILLG